MPLHENIPTLGGLGPAPEPSRRERLHAGGAAAQQQIAALLSRARGRAVALASLRGLSLLCAGWLVAVLCGALLASVSGSLLARLAALLLALLSAAGVAFFSLRSPLQRAAAETRHPHRLARLLGGPSELLSSVELTQHPPEGASTELLALLHLRAAAAAGRIDVARALPLSWLRGPLLALAGAAALWVALAALAPRHVSQGLLRLFRGDHGAPQIELSPIAGDLAITYLYPAYTGLPPRTEEGTAGDLHAPRGTEVRIAARADRDLAQAFAVVNGAVTRLEAAGQGNRQLSGSFTLTQPGAWSLRFADARGRTVAQGPARPIEIVADAAPQVAIETPKQAVLEVDPQGQVQLGWSATDDYGLQQVALVFQGAGAKEERIVLSTPAAPARRLRGTYLWDIARLSLRPGDKVSYHLEAKDNDAVDGAQKGVSATQAIKIFSAAEHSREALVHAQALWERLVALLGDRLEEKPAPSDGEAALQWYAQTGQKDKDGRALSAELSAAGTALLKDKLAPKAVGRALRYAATSLAPALQRTSIARAPLSRGAQGREGAGRVFSAALQNEVREEEKDVLYLQDLLDRARLDAMQELGKELAASRRELARLAEKLRKAPNEATKKEVLAEVARLRERINDLMQRMGELARGIRDEHLNEEAVKTHEKEQDLMSQLDDIQKKLQGDKIDEALKQLDQLSQQLEKLEQNLAKKGQQAGGEKYAEEARQLREAADELSKIRQQETDLEKRTGELRKQARAQAQKRLEQRGGKDLAKRLREKAAQAKKAIAQIDKKVAESLGLDDVLDSAESRVADLERALQLGEMDEALDLADRSLRSVEAMQGRLNAEQELARRYPGFMRDPQGVEKSGKGAQGAQKPLKEIVQQLQEAMPRDGQAMTPQQQAQLQKQRDEQRGLREQLGQVREKLGQVGKKVPIFGPQHERMLQEAQQGMGEAEDRLGRGEPRGAQAGEQQALEKLQQFEQAMKQMAQQGGQGEGSGLPMPWGEPRGGEGDESGEQGDGVNREKVEIPDAEASRGPAEFRKELLDAMKQAAPEKYKERVRQYYEELVK